MTNWPIERRWRILFPEDVREELTTRQLADQRACCLLGASGLGKTFELKHFEDLDREAGRVSPGTLRLAQFSDGLKAGLREAVAGRGPDLALHLDALDEAMAHNPWAEDQLAAWIRQDVGDAPPFLRITCRSTVRPKAVEEAMRATYGEISVYVASLQPLSDDDIANVARFEGVDPDAFVEEVRRSKAELLASQPLTLVMLLGHFRLHQRLPERRCDLFDQAVRRLADESHERLEKKPRDHVEADRVEAAAERLACLSILSGRQEFDLTDQPPADSLDRFELVRLPGVGFRFDFSLLRAVGLSGLCNATARGRFRFFHLQIAEYLAGRQIARLPLHQAKALLSSRVESRTTVAAPLRETAAFAAMMNPDLARWLADTDPEVVGLSDVADDRFRRFAMRRLLEKFRDKELTDAMLVWDGMPLEGFRNPEAEDDLRQVLRDRQEGCVDVLTLAVKMVESWGISSLHEDLADLVLDSFAPLSVRIDAGHVLKEAGASKARRRLLPLIAESPDDPNLELKALALESCWPEHLSDEAMLGHLVSDHGIRVIGSYAGFLLRLEREGFEAASCRLAGLEWAKGELDPGERASLSFGLTQRIARGALSEIRDPRIAVALADLILEAGMMEWESPYRSPFGQDRGFLEAESSGNVFEDQEVRRILLSHLASQADKARPVRRWELRAWGLIRPEDYRWLLEQAVDRTNSDAERVNFAEMASLLPPPETFDEVELWLRLKDEDPLRSVMPNVTSVRLDGEDARDARRIYKRTRRPKSVETGPTVVMSPRERLAMVLEHAEKDQPRLFFNICRELTLTAGMTEYGPGQFHPTSTSGWQAADVETRARITAVARRLLAETPDGLETSPDFPSTINTGYMPAVWLVLERDEGWFEDRPDEWWRCWSWHFLHSLVVRMIGVPDALRSRFFASLHRRARGAVRETILTAAVGSDQHTSGTLWALLDLQAEVADAELDASLMARLRDDRIGVDRVGRVARFLLLRDHDAACDLIRGHVETGSSHEDRTAELSLALLATPSRYAWDLALRVLKERPELARRILGSYALGRSGSYNQRIASIPEVTDGQIGDLIALFFEHFPPESDPDRRGGYFVSEEDAAILHRDQLVGLLGSRRSEEAVTALRKLERDLVRNFGPRAAWLRRPRSLAEREYRRSGWSPIPPATVAALLESAERRLIRSEDDALEGIVEAIRQYELSLRQSSPSPLEDLWNVPRTGKPSPKSEERISDKLCAAVRRYFSERAVAADREVQIRRRLVSDDQDGQPGSRLDVLVTVPAVGTEVGEAVWVPIEVKRSDNREAKTGLVDQLVNRYMTELGASRGVFVVVWLDAPGMTKNRPVWKSREEAVQALERQAAEVREKPDEPRRVEALVIDASLS